MVASVKVGTQEEGQWLIQFRKAIVHVLSKESSGTACISISGATENCWLGIIERWHKGQFWKDKIFEKDKVFSFLRYA